MPSRITDVHHRCLCLLTAASACILVAQSAQPRFLNNDMGIFACGVVFLAYIVHLIGCLEANPTLAAVGMNMAMFAHGFQLSYYYYQPLPASAMLPPIVLGALFLPYAAANECGVLRLSTVTQSTETERECEDETKDEFRDVELV